MAQRQRTSRAVAQTQTHNYSLLLAFLVTGVWANAIFAFILVQEHHGEQLAARQHLNVELNPVEARDTFLFPRRNQKAPDNAPRTQPYDEKSAPDLGQDFAYPEPVNPTQPDTPQTTEEGSESGNEISDIFNSLKALLAGEGGFQDILTLVIAGFALFGGGKFAASDGLFKAILAIFSKRSNFTELLHERLKASGATVSTRSPRKRPAKK